MLLTYLGQAGFLIQDKDISIVIDPYLSDCVEREVGFKRRQSPVMLPEELMADVMLNTHSHLDHLDIDALKVFALRDSMSFIGSPDCEEFYQAVGIDKKRYKILCAGNSVELKKNISVRAVYADHGELAPEAVGFLIMVNNFTIYNVGDSGLASERILESLGETTVDLMIAPINGAFGNLNGSEACMLASAVHPKILIGCHFGMFSEHGGDPEAFFTQAKKLRIKSYIMCPGEYWHIDKNKTLINQSIRKRNYQ